MERPESALELPTELPAWQSQERIIDAPNVRIDDGREVKLADGAAHEFRIELAPGLSR